MTSCRGITANHLRTASRLYEMRDQARAALGHMYMPTIRGYVGALRAAMARHRTDNPLTAAVGLVRENGPQVTEADGLAIIAAAVEMIEGGSVMRRLIAWIYGRGWAR